MPLYAVYADMFEPSPVAVYLSEPADNGGDGCSEAEEHALDIFKADEKKRGVGRRKTQPVIHELCKRAPDSPWLRKRAEWEVDDGRVYFVKGSQVGQTDDTNEDVDVRVPAAKGELYLVEEANPFFPEIPHNFYFCLDRDTAERHMKAHQTCATAHIPMGARVARQLDFIVEGIHVYRLQQRQSREYEDKGTTINKEAARTSFLYLPDPPSPPIDRQ